MTQITLGRLQPYPQRQIADTKTISEIIELWQEKRRFIVLSGPPGVGKTRMAEDFIYEMSRQTTNFRDINTLRITSLFPDFRQKVYSTEEIKKILSEKNVKFVWDIMVLHPQYTYEDLIRGYRMTPATVGTGNALSLEVREGLLGFTSRVVRLMNKTEQDMPLGCLILDEINRAPIGQLFGESLYALDRRDVSVTTPYDLQGEGAQFSIPADLMLLGTMNSVDRAVAGFDFALRRRFTLLTLASSETPIGTRWEVFGDATKDRVLNFYAEIKNLILSASKVGLIPLAEMVIGHSYFLPPDSTATKESAITWLARSYKFQIVPTIRDYDEQGLIEFPDSGTLVGYDIIKGRQPVESLTIEEIVDYLENSRTVRHEKLNASF